MAYTLRLRHSVRRALADAGVPDPVLAEAYIRLNRLTNFPAASLVRTADGMVYRFDFVDPGDRFREHFFSFHVTYAQNRDI